MKTEQGKQFGNESEKEVDESKKEAAREAREILGLRPEATLQDIKRVYRALALEFHPDKNPDDAERTTEIMKRLNELYEILCDDIELQQNIAEDELKDEADDLDLVALGDVFLSTLQLDVDPVIFRAIKAYQGEWAEQNEDKGQELDIKEEGSRKGDEEPGGKLDVTVEESGKDEKEKGGNIDIKA